MVRPKKQYNVQLEDDVIERIDRLAKKLDQTRSQLMRNFVIGGLEDCEMVDKTGIYSAIIFSRELMRKFKESVLNGKITLNKDGEITTAK